MAGIIDTITLAGTLVLAIPAALAGLDFLVLRGEPTIGAPLLVLAVALVVVQHRLTTPSDVPGLLAQRALGRVAKEPETDPEDE